MVESTTNNNQIDEEFQCSICWQVMFQPVTTACGHTFCKDCLLQTLKVKQECMLCRRVVIVTPENPIQINVTLQSLIDRKHPEETRKRREAYEQKLKEAQEKKRLENKSEYLKLPIFLSKLNIMPGMTTTITLKGRRGTDFFHLVSRQQYDLVTNQPLKQNRKFIMTRNLTDMQGFLLQFKALVSRTPSNGNFNTTIEVQGVARFQMSKVYIPDERIGLYSEEVNAIQFADGVQISDIDRLDIIKREAPEDQVNRLTNDYKQEVQTRLYKMEQTFNQLKQKRAQQQVDLQSVQAVYGPYPSFNRNQSIVERAETCSLHMLSHLELQNSNRELIFSQDVDERINACLKQLENPPVAQRLFVWDEDPEIKKKFSILELGWIIALGILLLISSYFRK